MCRALSSKGLLFVSAFFVFFIGFLVLVGPYQPRKSWPLVTASQKRLNIILLSEPRSGSSFTGEIFQQHREVFYLYEPLFHFLKLRPGREKNSPGARNKYDSRVSSFMKSIFNCTFDDDDYLAELKTARNKARCPVSTNSRSLWISRDCKVRLTRENLEKTCRQSRLTVAKLLITRLSGMTYPATKKLSLLCNSSAEFECLFIYLVRDPRAVLSSLLNVGFFDRQTATILKHGKFSKSYLLKLVQPRAEVMCQTLEENIDYIQRLSSQWRGKFIVLRYEDLVSGPKTAVENLFHFADLQVTRDISQWLKEHTTPSEEAAERNQDKAYSTVKNSLDILDKWRRNADMLVVNTVEKSCRRILRRLGYIPVGGSEVLLRNLTVPLFTRNDPMAKGVK